MASYEIRWEGARAAGVGLGETQVVRARDWMAALSVALERLGLDQGTLERAVCLLDRAGVVEVTDPDTATRFVVRQLDSEDGEGESPSVEAASVSRGVDVMDAPSTARSGAFSRYAQVDPQSLARLERDLQALPNQGDERARASAVLDLLLRTVPAESASVLKLQPSTGMVRFLALRGPASEHLALASIPEGTGLVGVVMRSGTTLVAQEVERRTEHFAGIDATTGYHTRALMACPVRVRASVVGAIELLNPFGGAPFSDGHRAAAELAARRMGALLG